MNNKTKSYDISKERKWIYIFILLFIVFLLVNAILGSIFGEKPNSWNGISPGSTLSEEKAKQIGEIVEIRDTTDGSAIDYKSDFKVVHNQVILDKDNKIKFIKIYFKHNPSYNIQSEIVNLGPPSFMLRAPEVSFSTEAYVFLEEGVVLLAHQQDKSIEQKWLFEPTTKEIFLETWGQELSTESSHQEPLPEGLENDF